MFAEYFKKIAEIIVSLCRRFFFDVIFNEIKFKFYLPLSIWKIIFLNELIKSMLMQIQFVSEQNVEWKEEF